ncbi:hypothetical protein [Halomonas denitrificans]|nr:hypothetical protein [Halomonas denitrificans]
MSVALRAPESPLLVRLFIILGGVMTVLGVLTMQFGLAAGGLVFAGFGLLMQFLGKANPRRLTIADGTLSHVAPHQKQRNFEVDLAAIEGIELRDREGKRAHPTGER